MKRYNIYIFLLLALSVLFNGCRNDEPFDNKAFIEAGDKVSNVLVYMDTEEDQRDLQVSIAQPEDYEVVITYKADPSLLNTYNEAYYDNAIILPAGFYEFPEPRVSIPAGSVQSNSTTIYFINLQELDRDLTYVLPVTIADANIDVLASARTSYFIFRGAALINVVADIEENYLHIDRWATPEPLTNMQQVTMEALFRARDFDRMISTVMGIEGLFLIRIGDSGFPPNQIQIATNKGNFPDADSNKGLPTNEWIHVGLTYDSATGNSKLYVNGILQGEATLNLGELTLAVDGTDGFYIGRSYSDDRYLAGDICECRIWNVVRTKEQLEENVYMVDPASDGLVAYWKCDEGVGNVVKDHTGNGNDLRSKDGVDLQWTPVTLPGKDK